MRVWQLFITSFVGLVCLGLAVTLVVLGRSAATLQQRTAEQQQQLQNSVIGPRGQQLSQAILQEMGSVAATNANMRELLELHGFTLKMDSDAAPAGTEGQTVAEATPEEDSDNE